MATTENSTEIVSNSHTQMLSTLWGAVDRNKLTDSQLDRLSCSQGITHHMQEMAETIEGIGCLIDSDGSNNNIAAGNFQDASDVPNLLFGIAHTLEMLADAVFVSSEAAYLKAQREIRNAQVESVRKLVAANS